ncbi:membrane protein containing Mechanosensitive ion channel MscS domain protein [Rhodopirellula maiorica SM1]|uniref:Membrane protein containing Mechanosensitive ion channel MscS domain protein n=1 Tax=Rhodopirellula maiorica SM1 TaxID=1265738 RepID=M5S6A2_9BACT|nr:mechanosensitive ion channel domain-containing protein [Rhodopirellula maiorica]EMI21719.1 membrane protein containing Mechanosensitive ion channel MscS domain protein [Rhodopirellula maiorica SM1]
MNQSNCLLRHVAAFLAMAALIIAAAPAQAEQGFALPENVPLPTAVQVHLEDVVVPASFTEPSAAPEAKVATVIKKETIATELASIEAATNLSEEDRKTYVERLRKATEWLDNQEVAKKRLAEIETFLLTLPTVLAEAQAGVAAPPEPEPAVVPAGGTIAQLEQQLIGLRTQIEADEKELQRKEREIENRTVRLGDLAKETVELEKRLGDAKKQVATLGTEELSSRVQSIEQQARVLCLEQQLITIKAERRRLEEVAPLLPLQRDLTNRTLNHRKKQLVSWQTAVDKWRKDESLRQAAEARRVADESHPALKSAAEVNAEIAESRIKTAADIERIGKMHEQLQAKNKHFDEAFETLRSKVEHAGATSSTGLLLQKQRGELPKPEEFAKRVEIVETEMPATHLQLTEWKQMRRDVSDPDEAAKLMVESLAASVQQYDHDNVVSVVSRLLRDRRDLLDNAIADEESLLRKLNELELINQTVETQVDEFRQFLDQRVLWIRSSDAIALKDLREASKGFLSLMAPSKWIEVAQVFAGDMLRRPIIMVFLASSFLLLLLFHAQMLAAVRRLSQPPEPGTEASFLRYAAAFGITVFLAVRWPILLLAAGCRLRMASGSTEWTQAVGDACVTTVLFLWACSLVRELSRREGVGERVFKWSPTALAKVRNVVDLTVFVGTPVFALLQLTQFSEVAEMRSLQRLLFISILAFVGLQIGWLVRPWGPFMLCLQREDSTSMTYRLRHPIWLAVTGAPIAFAILSLVGYHFSAYQLSGRLAETGIALVGIIVLYSLAICWLEVTGFNRALAKQIAAEAEQAQSLEVLASPTNSDDDDADSDMLAPVDLQETVNSEFCDLLRWGSVMLLICGGWIIWSDVLPALRVLDRVVLWTNIETIAETVVDRQGYQSVVMTDRSVPTTLTDAIAAILVVMATMMIGRRLPSVLALTVLDRLPLESGTHQAVSILVRYAATIAGILFACQVIRLSWSSVQWLAAAMTVGLGFGLQEIFANLVSGLIILFERPIRVGDMVTVGDLTGNVSRMQMRATTITDFDRREMIVPNKKFITDNVINWTLSDPISRIVLPVGVAYGTDVAQVQRILLKIAERNPSVLKEPAPSTLFKGFAESTLDIRLHVFIPKRDVYTVVLNELNSAIVNELRRSGIEIAFPQRDLHIKSVQSLAALMPREQERDRDRVRDQNAA